MHEDLLERISQLESEIRIMYFKTKDTLREVHDVLYTLEKRENIRAGEFREVKKWRDKDD